MTTSTRDGHTVITASEGHFLQGMTNGVYGVEISLGIHDAPQNYEELPIGEWPSEYNE